MLVDVQNMKECANTTMIFFWRLKTLQTFPFYVIFL